MPLTLPKPFRQEVRLQNHGPRRHSQALDTDLRPPLERAPGADLVQPGNGAAEELPGVRRIELRRRAAQVGEGGEAEFPMPEKRFPRDRHRRGHRQLGGGHLGGEAMLLQDLRIVPARRPVELEHEHALAAAELIHPVFVAVQGEEATVRVETHGACGIEHPVRGQSREGRIDFVYHRLRFSIKAYRHFA